MNKSEIFWQTYLNLEKEVLEVTKYIFVTDEIQLSSKEGTQNAPCNSQLETFSPFIADLLVNCCVQIEAISKELYFENGGTKARGDNSIYFDEDCLKLIDIKWQTHNKVVMVVYPGFNLTKEENFILKPLKEAHKRQGTYWERAYQAVKHDRYVSLPKGNIKALINAMAALYLLNLYYRKDSFITSYLGISKIDFSIGSRLFSVKPPVVKEIWYGNNPIVSDSPYIANYKESDYRQIESAQKKEEESLNEYWRSQPELKEQDFIDQLSKAKEEASKKGDRVMEIWELAKYRLRKAIPENLPFKEKVNRLVNSEQWHGSIYQLNKPLPINELTEDNIQKEMDKISINWGMEIQRQFQKLEWIKLATSQILEVHIPTK
ncbi:MAG: hypothetical protein LKK13_00585 [Bacilli bacterium]|jgi:hypothetical protein|nr:hypothetical protein [Bacilli bacterium]